MLGTPGDLAFVRGMCAAPWPPGAGIWRYRLGQVHTAPGRPSSCSRSIAPAPNALLPPGCPETTAISFRVRAARQLAKIGTGCGSRDSNG